MTTLLVLAVSAAACSGGSDAESSPDGEDGAAAEATATTVGPATEDGTEDAAADGPTIPAAPPATVAGQPVESEPGDDEGGEDDQTGDNGEDGDDARAEADEPPADPDATVPRDTIAPPAEIARVISLAPTHTETIFAIGAEALLIAVDPGSDFPDAAIALQNGELRPSTGDTGAIEALQPDLVILGDDPTDLAGRLGEVGIPAWKRSQPDSIDGAYEQIRELGELLGAGEAADALVAEMRSELDAIRAALPAAGTLTYFHENDPGFITPAAGSFIDLVYAELGLSPIPTSGENRAGFVQSSSDEVIAGDPDVIVLADGDCCGMDVATASARPGWASIAAVDSGAIVEVPDAITQRWGPRLVDWWRLVADAAAVAAAG